MSAAHIPETAANRTTIAPISTAGRILTELRKAVDYRGGRIFLWVVLALMLLFAVLGVLLISGDELSIFEAAYFPLLPLVYALPILGMILAVDEWRQKTVMVTYVLDSNRTAVLIAKLIAGMLIGLALTIVGMAVGIGMGLLAGVDPAGLAEIPEALPATAASVVLHVLLGFALGGATFSVVVALVLLLVVGQIVPSIMAAITETAWLAPYVDLANPLTMMLNGQWPEDWLTFGVAAGVWIVLPLAIAIWRNGTRDIS